jgi:hypothetical protein
MSYLLATHLDQALVCMSALAQSLLASVISVLELARAKE